MVLLITVILISWCKKEPDNNINMNEKKYSQQEVMERVAKNIERLKREYISTHSTWIVLYKYVK